MPMGEVQTLIDEELSKVGRVAVFVDVCRAGNIGSIKNTTVNAVVEKLGEAEGEILGLMASRPKELSYEGPEFGGGHGAFSYFLLKALAGAADKNNDGKVDVNEVINYVQTEVAKAHERQAASARVRQHGQRGGAGRHHQARHRSGARCTSR